MSPAPVLPVLRRVLVVTDTADAPSSRVLIRLLRQAGVTVGAADVGYDTRTLDQARLSAIIKADTRTFDPQAAIFDAPADASAPMATLLRALPKRLSVVWAEDPTRSTLSRARLSTGASKLLSRWRHFSIVSPGAVLAGTTGLVRHDALTRAGTRAYGQALLDVLSAAFRLPRVVPGAAEVPDSAGLVAVEAAESRLGDPYVWAGAGPDVFDCSGLVMWAWAHAGVTLPHYSGAQYAMTTPVPMDELEPGDLLFPADPGEHVAMYIGDGKIIQAPEPGEDVEIVTLASTGHFFVHATQVGTDGAVGEPATSTVQAYALGQVKAMPGWGVAQWPYLQALWARESGWRVNATNPVSGAYGIPQALPATKMAAAGSDWVTDPDTQIDWGIAYIRARYGTPQVAWAHESQFGWY